METHQKKQNNAEKEPKLIDIRWTAPEFEKRKKTAAWFLAVGLIALIFFTIALLMKNFIFAILILLSVFTIFIYSVKKPNQINFKIDGKGISIGEKIHSYDELNSFWIFYEPSRIKELSLKSKKMLAMLIKIPLADRDPVLIRQALLKFIPEEKQEESLVDIISRSIGF